MQKELYNLFAPSSLTTFLECHHAFFLDLKSVSKNIEAKENPTAQLLQKKGLEHEVAYLNHLKDEGKKVAEIPRDCSFLERISSTIEAMQSGADIVYQAVLFNKPWRGDADFLIKCDRPSKFGNHSYEVLDTKLKQTAGPKHIIQLCVYSELLSGLQELPPKEMHLFLGNGEKQSFKVSDFFYYYTRVKKRFEAYAAYSDLTGHRM